MMELNIRTVTGGPMEVNTYVIGAKGGLDCIIIDPGADLERIVEAVSFRTVSAVLLTHGHFDHICYAQPFIADGARLYVHEGDAAMIGDAGLNLGTMVGMDVSLPEADVLLREGDVVHEAGLELSVLHTPGHTVGSVCYQCGDVLFSGDTLFYRSYGRTDFPGGSNREMYISLMRLMELEPDTVVYPGHGMKTKIAWERGNYA